MEARDDRYWGSWASTGFIQIREKHSFFMVNRAPQLREKGGFRFQPEGAPLWLQPAQFHHPSLSPSFLVTGWIYSLDNVIDGDVEQTVI